MIGIPAGYPVVTPHLTLDNCAAALELYKKAFGAEERCRMPGPGGKIMHAEIRLGDSSIFLNDEFPEMGARGPKGIGGTPVTIHLFVADVDKAYDRAVKAGCTAVAPPTDMFWGDRYGILHDPFGHHWSLASRKEELTPDQIAQRMQQGCPQ